MLPLRLLILGLAVGALCAGCNSILGLGNFSVSPDAGSGITKPDSVARCADSNAGGQCYACAPQTNTQYLNACTEASCVPFDDTKRVKNLPLDGNLPLVPDVPDAGPG